MQVLDTADNYAIVATIPVGEEPVSLGNFVTQDVLRFPAAAVPTLGDAALVVLAVVLALAGLRAGRSRTASASASRV